MLAGVMKASPFAALLAALSAKDALAYAGVVSMLSAILVVGALWGAAKAWRQRAEARADEADQLEKQAIVTAAKLDDLDRAYLELKTEMKARPDLRELVALMQAEHAELREKDAEEHRAIVGALERLSCSVQDSLAANTTAIETFSKNIPWEKLTEK